MTPLTFPSDSLLYYKLQPVSIVTNTSVIERCIIAISFLSILACSTQYKCDCMCKTKFSSFLSFSYSLSVLVSLSEKSKPQLAGYSSAAVFRWFKLFNQREALKLEKNLFEKLIYINVKYTQYIRKVPSSKESLFGGMIYFLKDGQTGGEAYQCY